MRHMPIMNTNKMGYINPAKAIISQLADKKNIFDSSFSINTIYIYKNKSCIFISINYIYKYTNCIYRTCQGKNKFILQQDEVSGHTIK